jgi:aspartyl-tRNA(Asn)/glutamyl-tRNA(Gln) amidotransferase subunit A
MYNGYEELRKDLASKKVSVKEVTEFYLNEIEKGKHLNAFLSVFKEEALARADEADKKLAADTAGRLAGMVIAVKDVLAIKGKKLTCGSKILENFESLYTATCIQKLIKEDAIIIGKTNCDEFAMGSSNENSAFGAVLNPFDNSRVPGGSSGGSAAAVAAGMCMAAIGTDTGGSVRQPAAFCGVVGLKPTYGRISRYGLTAFASSFDTVGIFSNDLRTCALLLEVMAGKDENDSTSSGIGTGKYSSSIDSGTSEREITIGVLEEFAESEGLQHEIKAAFETKVEALKKRGFKVKPVHLPHVNYSIQTYYILTTAEASSNLARYDGARYGARSDDSATVEDMYVNSRTEGFGTEVKRRIMLGTYVLSAGYYDAYYKKAQKARRLIKDDFVNAFEKVDLILSPTTPTTAFKLGEKTDNPLEMYLNDIFTTTSNLTGNPAVSIPIGKDKSGLAIGMQIIGNDFDEARVLGLAAYIMRNC